MRAITDRKNELADNGYVGVTTLVEEQNGLTPALPYTKQFFMYRHSVEPSLPLIILQEYKDGSYREYTNSDHVKH